MKDPRTGLLAALVLFGTTAVALEGGRGSQPQPPDLILRNAKVVTVDARFSIAQAIAISGTDIAARLTTDLANAEARKQRDRLSAEGRAVEQGVL